MRFVGRDRELKKLNELYQEEEFQFVVIYGRRRVGKTMLINEFLKKKRSAYYMAVEGTSKENLSGISKVLLAEKNEEFYMPEFPDFESLLSYIDHLCKNTDDQERLVIAIDEFPYLAGTIWAEYFQQMRSTNAYGTKKPMQQRIPLWFTSVVSARK